MLQSRPLPRKHKCCLFVPLRPSPVILLDGALTLKMVTQICFLLDFFITSSYALIFVIVYSDVWFYMSALYTLQTLSTVVLLCDTATFELGKTCVYHTKAYLTWIGLLSLTLFYLFQDSLIQGRMRGTLLSIHFVVIKVIYDLFQMFFVWSRHLHESGQTALIQT